MEIHVARKKTHYLAFSGLFIIEIGYLILCERVTRQAEIGFSMNEWEFCAAPCVSGS
jgi:hypothetical protein